MHSGKDEKKKRLQKKEKRKNQGKHEGNQKKMKRIMETERSTIINCSTKKKESFLFVESEGNLYQTIDTFLHFETP